MWWLRTLTLGPEDLGLCLTCHLLVMSPWASYSSALCLLSFCKMGVIVVITDGINAQSV